MKQKTTNYMKDHEREFWKNANSYSAFKCHDGTIEVFQDPQSGIKVYAGGASRGLVLYYGTILIDIGADQPNELQLEPSNWAPAELTKYTYKRIIMDVDDGDAPTFPIGFWKNLVKMLRNEKKDVIVACLGGHGRTGTVVSLLAWFMDVAKDDPIAFIRKRYCTEAVETSAQKGYIEKMIGKKLKSAPSIFIFTDSSYVFKPPAPTESNAISEEETWRSGDPKQKDEYITYQCSECGKFRREKVPKNNELSGSFCYDICDDCYKAKEVAQFNTEKEPKKQKKQNTQNDDLIFERKKYVRSGEVRPPKAGEVYISRYSRSPSLAKDSFRALDCEILISEDVAKKKQGNKTLNEKIPVICKICGKFMFETDGFLSSNKRFIDAVCFECIGLPVKNKLTLQKTIKRAKNTLMQAIKL